MTAATIDQPCRLLRLFCFWTCFWNSPSAEGTVVWNVVQKPTGSWTRVT